MPNAVSSHLRRNGRIALPSLVFLPVCILLLRSVGLIDNCCVFRASRVALSPGLSMAKLVQSFGGNLFIAAAVGLLSGLAWLALVACALHKIAQLVTAEDFEWPVFWGGFVLGLIPGALFGCRVWVWLYRVTSLTTCLVVTALAGGIALGIYMGSYWSKARYE